MAEYPCNFQYHPEEDPTTISFDGVEEAIQYQIEKSDDINPWTVVYDESETVFDYYLSPGTYFFKGKAKTQGGWGPYGPTEKLVIE